MEISNKALFLLIVTIVTYTYMSQLFNKPSVQSRLLNAFNGTNHTMVDLIIQRSNTMAAIVSTTSVAILNSLPVNI
jgi:hypothetical protein